MDIDYTNMKDNYRKCFKEFGVTPQALRCPKGKQKERVHSLLHGFVEFFDTKELFSNPSILDIGCGFGDANKYIKDFISQYEYTGIDICDFFVDQAVDIYKNDIDKKFICHDFLTYQFKNNFDFAICSGATGTKLNIDNYDYTYRLMQKALSLVNVGVAFDFNSTKVDYFAGPDIFHYEPSKVIELCYSLSRSIVLKNDYFPFEFCVYVYKDTSFEKKDTIFNRYKVINKYPKN